MTINRVVLATNCTGRPTAPGEWEIVEFNWWRDPAGKEQRGPAFVFGCPNGRGMCSVPIAPAPANSNRCVWTWDGNVERPSLSPSINCIALDEHGNTQPGIGCGWHGFMSAGRIQ